MWNRLSNHTNTGENVDPTPDQAGSTQLAREEDTMGSGSGSTSEPGSLGF